MKRKTCLFCVYFGQKEGFYGSMVTPATPDYLLCLKKHWSLYADDSPKEWRETLTKAETCKDFIEVPPGE
jgi:hypothetical protein